MCFYALIIYIMYWQKKYRDKIIEESQNLKISEQRYRIVAKQSDSFIFEYDIATKKVVYFENFKRIFGRDLRPDEKLDICHNMRLIHQESSKTFIKLILDAMNGTLKSSGEIRVYKQNVGYTWCLMRVTTIFDENDQPVRVLGKITDIDKQKKETQRLHYWPSRIV